MIKRTTPLTRRHFVKSSAALLAGTAIGPNILIAQEGGEANSKLAIASIGARGKGQSDLANAADRNHVVAVCDVDLRRLDEAGNDHQDARKFQDFRQMLEEMGDKIDAVTISTPDHTHFPAAMMAVSMGKHVMVQKPLCNTIWECRELHKLAKEKGVVTQMGNQGRMMEGQRLVKEWIEQGAIGELQSIDLWTNRPIWAQGALVPTPADAPEQLDWQLWLAQEPAMDYFTFEFQGNQNQSVHPFAWRGWWAYGSGALGDMGCHIMDATFSVLGQAIPVKVEAEASEFNDLAAPLKSKVTYHFAASDWHPELTVTWRDGNPKYGFENLPDMPEMMKGSVEKLGESGMIFQGSEGVIYSGDAYCGSASIYPNERFNEVRRRMADGDIEKTEARSTHPGDPQREWTHAIKEGLETTSGFDYSAPLTEFVLLGNLALRAKKTISWDKEKGTTGNAEADAFVKRPAYREGWDFKA